MSLSNTTETPTLRGAGITLASVKRKTDVSTRRTKIICTMGPASWSEEGLATLLDAGMNVARFNFSHGDHEGHGAVLERLRTVAKAKARNIGRYRTSCGWLGGRDESIRI
jgi:pyruvate kinase